VPTTGNYFSTILKSVAVFADNQSMETVTLDQLEVIPPGAIAGAIAGLNGHAAQLKLPGERAGDVETRWRELIESLQNTDQLHNLARALAD
jgi:hypothetical protein